VLEATYLERQLQIIYELNENEAVELLSRMSPDLATDLVGRLDLLLMRRYVSRMPANRRDQIIELLQYPEDSVGGVMTNDILSIPADTLCGEAKKIVESRLDEVHFSTVVFAVDDNDRRLKGSITLRDLLAEDDEKILDEAMDPYIQALNPFDDAENAAYRIVSGQLAAMAVISTQGTLIGAMTVEAAIAQLVPATSSLQGLRIFS
jgi:magnesium transporter